MQPHKFSASCTEEKCKWIDNFYNSKEVKTLKRGRKPYDINFRSVIAFQDIGKGLTSIESFCHSMNMPPPMQNNAYNDKVLSLCDCYVSASQESMVTAASETTPSLESKKT